MLSRCMASANLRRIVQLSASGRVGGFALPSGLQTSRIPQRLSSASPRFSPLRFLHASQQAFADGFKTPSTQLEAKADVASSQPEIDPAVISADLFEDTNTSDDALDVDEVASLQEIDEGCELSAFELRILTQKLRDVVRRGKGAFQEAYSLYKHIQRYTTIHNNVVRQRLIRLAYIEKQLDAVIELYEHYLAHGLYVHDARTLVAVLVSYSSRRDRHGVQRVWRHFKNALSTGEVPVTGDLLHLYNSMLSHVSTVGDLPACMRLLEEMADSGTPPDVISYNTVLNVCSKLGQTETAQNIVATMHENGIKPSNSTYNTLVDMYVRADDMEAAIDMFTEMLESIDPADIDEYSFNSIISGFSKREEFDQCIEWSQKLEDLGLGVSEVTMTTVVNGYVESGRVVEAARFITSLIEKGYKISPSTFNCLTRAYLSRGNVKEAIAIFEYQVHISPLKPDISTFNTFMLGFRRLGEYDKMLQWYKKAKQSSSLTLYSYNILLRGAFESSNLMLCESVLADLQASCFAPDHGSVQALMKVFSTHGKLDEAMTWFRYGIKEKMRLSQDAFALLVDALARAGRFEDGHEVAAQALKTHGGTAYLIEAALQLAKSKKDVEFASELLDTYLTDATSAFDRARLTSAFMSVLNHAGRHREVMELYHDARRERPVPKKMVSVVLDSCNHNGSVEEGISTFKALRLENYPFNVNNYNTFIELLAAHGRLDDACKVFDEMLITYRQNSLVTPNMKTLRTLCQPLRDAGKHALAEQYETKYFLRFPKSMYGEDPAGNRRRRLPHRRGNTRPRSVRSGMDILSRDRQPLTPVTIKSDGWGALAAD